MKYNLANPPYESLLEEVFAKSIKKYLKNEIILQEQHEVETLCGLFRFDFIIEYNSRIIAFECDGQNFHDENAAIYDFWRDSVLLAENHAQIIFRLSGPVLMQKMADCLFLLSYIYAEIFNHKTIQELKIQTSPLVLEQVFHQATVKTPNQNHIFKILFPEESKISTTPVEEISWICLKSESYADDRHKKIYGYIKRNNGGRLNPLIYKYHKKYKNYGL